MTNKQLLDAYVVACNQESVCRAEQKQLNEKADKLENEVLDRMNSENLLSRLPPHASQLLRDLNAEFYGGPLANADAFRILPILAKFIDGVRDEDR